MPGYIFTHPETGERKRLVMSVKEMLNRTDKLDGNLKIDGVVWERCISCEHERVNGTSSGWPMTSEAMGTHPDNVRESIDHFAKRGVRVDYDSKGRMVFDNAAHRRRVLRAANYTDKQGYFDA